MTATLPWYTKPWREKRSATRTIAALVCFLVAGVAELVLAARNFHHGAMRFTSAAVAAAILIYFGTTLVATCVWQRRSRKLN